MKAPATRRKPAGARNVKHCDAVPQGVLLYTKQEVAAMARVSVRCVNEQMRRGWLPFVKLSRQLVRFRQKDVERWLEEAAERERERQ